MRSLDETYWKRIAGQFSVNHFSEVFDPEIKQLNIHTRTSLQVLVLMTSKTNAIINNHYNDKKKMHKQSPVRYLLCLLQWRANILQK